MTEEQIEQKSKDYAEKNNDIIHPHKLALERAYSTGLRVGITEATKKLQEENEQLREQIEKLKDKVQMYDFFYEDNGFKRRGLNNSIQIAEYIDKLEAYNEKLLDGDIEKHNKIV